MTLTLSILRCPDQVAPETRELHGGEFSIGRGADNDWVLADPDRHLSKRHCLLAFRSGGWHLADLSTNGTFLNRETEPVGAGAPRALRDGDRLRLGPYEIEVRIAEDAFSAEPGTSPARGQMRSEVADPFHDDPFDAVLGPSVSGPFSAETGAASLRPSAALPADYDPLAPDPAEVPFGGPVQADHTPAIEDAFQAPRPMANLLPDDWDIEAPLTPGPAIAEPEPAAPRPPPITAAQAAPVAQPTAIAEPVSDETGLLAAFLKGADVPEARPSDPQAVMTALGEAFRALVSGLRQTLIARAAIKGEFRIEQTVIRASGNNPLKFSAGDDDALAALLGVGRHTQMRPAEAVAEALKDIRVHELASMAAMQSAVRTLVARFDPASLHGAGGEGGLAAITGSRKARAWDAFEKLHAEIAAALADDFDSVFGKAFARAYEQALAEITAREETA